jgi:hypothetical protein
MEPDEKQIARKLVEMGKIRILLFTNGNEKPVSLNSDEVVAFIFSDAECKTQYEFHQFKNLSPDEFVLSFLAQLDSELSIDKIGIQVTNYSVIRFLDYARYQERCNSVKNKLTAKQTLSKDESLLHSAFSDDPETYGESKVKETKTDRSFG